MPDRATKNEDSRPGIVSKGFAAIILGIAVLLIVMIVGGVLGVLLQTLFEPALGESSRAFAFLGPVLVVSAWVYAKYFTSKGSGARKDRGLALGGVAVFALLMVVWFANEAPPSPSVPAKEAEQLAKPCIGGPIARVGCELNKENIRNAQERRRQ